MTRLMVVGIPNKISKVQKCLGAGWRVVATVGHFRRFAGARARRGRQLVGCDVGCGRAEHWSSSVSVRRRLEPRPSLSPPTAIARARELPGTCWRCSGPWPPRPSSEVRCPRPRSSDALWRTLASSTATWWPPSRPAACSTVSWATASLPLLRPFGGNHSAGRVQSARCTSWLRARREREAELRPVLDPHSALPGGASLRAGRSRTLTATGCQLGSRRRLTRSPLKGRSAPARHEVQHLERQCPVERRPKAPFTTSTLAQAASAELGFTPSQTMALAQKLFEAGAITYHRTDSVSLSPEAIEMAREWLAGNHPSASPARQSPTATPTRRRKHTRPFVQQPSCSTLRRRSNPTPSCSSASSPAASLLRSASLPSSRRRWPASLPGSTRSWPLGRSSRSPATSPPYREKTKTPLRLEQRPVTTPVSARDGKLPRLTTGQRLELARVDRQGDETKPPPVSRRPPSVREMERTGIGRPSTYASTVQTLFTREYLAELKKAVMPSSGGASSTPCSSWPFHRSCRRALRPPSRSSSTR